MSQRRSDNLDIAREFDELNALYLGILEGYKCVDWGKGLL